MIPEIIRDLSMKKGGAVKEAVKGAKKGAKEASKATKSVIEDWEWRPSEQVIEEVGLQEVPDYIQGGFGNFMAGQQKRAQAGEVGARDLIKAYTITRSSVNRSGLPRETATKTGMKLPKTKGLVRPEGAFSEWLGSRQGQNYLKAAERGEIDEKAIADLQEKFAPFGMASVLANDMRWAVKNAPTLAENLSETIVGDPQTYRSVSQQLQGIGPAKSGFMGSLIGRGDFPTLDARQLRLHTGAGGKEAAKYMSRQRGLGGEQAVGRLADRQQEMNLAIDPSLDPFYQHLTHHAVWDKVADEKTTHEDIVRAMMGYAKGGKVSAVKGALEGASKSAKQAAEAARKTPGFEKFIEKSAVKEKVYRGQRRAPQATGFALTQGRGTPSFATDPEVANVYSRQLGWGKPEYGSGSTVMPAYLQMENPLDLRAYGEYITLSDFIENLPNVDLSKPTVDGGFGYEDIAEMVRGIGSVADKTGAKYDIEAASPGTPFRMREFGELADAIEEMGAAGKPDAIDMMLFDTSIDAFLIGDSKNVRNALKGAGYDGVIHKDAFDVGGEFYEGDVKNLEGGHYADYVHDSYRPFYQGKIKSAIGNVGDYDIENPDITKAKGGIAKGVAKGAKAAKKAVKDVAEKSDIYHVTYTSNLDKIMNSGLSPLGGGKSNWVQAGTGDRYQANPAVFAFDNPKDALRWAMRMEMGSKDKAPLSILKLKRQGNWTNDPSEDYNLVQFGKALQNESFVPAENITKVVDFSAIPKPIEMKMSLNDWLQSQGDELSYAKGGKASVVKGVLEGAKKAAKAAKNHPIVFGPAAPLGKEEIRRMAQQMAEQTTGEFVRVNPKQSVNPAGKSKKQFDRERGLSKTIRANVPERDVPVVDIAGEEGNLMVAVPGDPTIGGVLRGGSLDEPPRGTHELVGIEDVEFDVPVQLYGGPRYGDEDKFWASNITAASGIQNPVTKFSQAMGDRPVIGMYTKMTPDSSRFALHLLDSLLAYQQPHRLPKKARAELTKLVRAGNPKAGKFPGFAGFDDPETVLLQAKQDSELRKHISKVLAMPSVNEPLKMRPGLDVLSAISHPEIENLQTGASGFSLGVLRPGAELTEGIHPTYSHDIPGEFLGQTKYPIPAELAFPRTMQYVRENIPTGQPFNTMKMVGAREVIDPQYIDQIKMYEELMKKYTGRKKGGLASLKKVRKHG